MRIKADGQLLDNILVKIELRQEDCLSHILFNTVMGKIIKKTYERI